MFLPQVTVLLFAAAAAVTVTPTPTPTETPRPRSLAGSRRIRPTSTSSMPTASFGVGNSGRSSTRTLGASLRMSAASSAESASPSSTQIASECPTSTGTRTHVADTGRSGSSMIFRVSATSFDSSSDSSPTQSQSITRLCSDDGSARSCSIRSAPAWGRHFLPAAGFPAGVFCCGRKRAGPGDRLVRRDAHACEADCVVQRLEHARERDRAAVRVRDDPVALQCLQGTRSVHLRHDERIAVDEAVRRRLVDADRAPRRGVWHQRTARRRPDREEAKVEVACGQPLGCRLLDLDLVVAEAEAPACRAR